MNQSFLKSELTGWKPLELAWLAAATAVILGLSLYWRDSPVSLLAALTGVWCVILTGKGKRSSFLFGTVNVIFYAVISLQAKYYGEVMLNLLYYLPMNFVGWFAWKSHMNEETGEVIKRRLPPKRSVLIYGLTAAAIVLYGLFLKAMGGKLPFIDSMSTVVSVTAQILSVKRLTEQWVLWIVVDVVTVIMWGINFAQGGETVATLAMWSVYLLNAIIMYIRWNREGSDNEV
ncbi:MAG: nicotinamide mononucleotide transporter [Lawsonibacter sp.]|nr:nicotinamide mononucleotide transporter [Lawsonibacter sp.]